MATTTINMEEDWDSMRLRSAPVQLEFDFRFSPELEAFRAGYVEGYTERGRNLGRGTPSSLKLERATKNFLQGGLLLRSPNGDKV